MVKTGADRNRPRPSRARAAAAATAAVLCLISLTAGLLLSYGSRVFFKPDPFAARVDASLRDPRVAALVANRLTDGLIEQRRNLTAFRPVILSASEAMVSSAPFRAVVRRAAKIAHQTMISQTGVSISLSVRDAGVILRSALSANPELAGKIPAAATTWLAGSNDVPGAGILIRIVRYARAVRISAVTLLSCGLLLAALSLLLATRRRLFLLRFGIAIAVAALLLCLVVRFGGSILARGARDELTAGALAGVWNAFLGGLASWSLVFGGIGLVIAAGASSLLERVDVPAIGRKAGNWLLGPPESKRIRLVRGLGLLGVGLLAMLSPSALIVGLAIFAGFVVFFIGLQEFFTVVMNAIPQRESLKESAAEQRHRRPPARILAVCMVGSLLIGTGLWYLLRAGQPAAQHGSLVDKACNGHLDLCNRPLDQVVFPASHNSMSAADQADWMFPNQEKSIPLQLEDGIRGFLIDVHYGMPAGNRVKTVLDDEVAARTKYEAVLGKEGVQAAMRIRDRLVGVDEGGRAVYLCHGFCELGATPLVPMLRKMRDFLVASPDEVIVIIIQDEGVTAKDIETCFRQSGLIDFVYRGGVSRPWPTLGEMIESDQRVVVFAENNSAGVPWYHQAFESVQETPYRFHRPEEFTCKPNRGGTSGSLFLINHWIETAPAPMPANAEMVNAYDFLLQRARQCQRERGMLPNLIAVDFYATGGVVRVADTLNGEAPGRPGEPVDSMVANKNQK